MHLSLRVSNVPRVSFNIHDVDDLIVGEVWLLVIRGQGHVGYMLPTDFQGVGLATQTLHLLCWIAFNGLAVREMFSHAHASNKSSINVMRRVGFAPADLTELFTYGLVDYEHFKLAPETWTARGEPLKTLLAGQSDCIRRAFRAMTEVAAGAI